MENDRLIAAYQNASTTLNDSDKANWNKLVDFAKSKNLDPKDLDFRNPKLGFSVIDEFNKLNPGNQFDPKKVPLVQNYLQQVRTSRVGEMNERTPDEVITAKTPQPGQTEGEPEFGQNQKGFMGNISKVDNWPGSKTLSFKFPTITEQGDMKGGKVIQGGKTLGFVDPTLTGKQEQEKYFPNRGGESLTLKNSNSEPGNRTSYGINLDDEKQVTPQPKLDESEIQDFSNKPVPGVDPKFNGLIKEVLANAAKYNARTPTEIKNIRDKLVQSPEWKKIVSIPGFERTIYPDFWKKVEFEIVPKQFQNFKSKNSTVKNK